MTAHMTINGAAVSGSRLAEVINPATGLGFAEAPDATIAETDAAIAAAKAAFPGWSAVSDAERRELVGRFAASLRAHSAGLARLLTLEQGKPLVRAEGEIAGAAAFADGFCNIRLDPEILRDDDETIVIQYRRPLGVVACITAWNFPVMLAIWKLVPALIAGNSVVLKPSPYTPLATLKLGQLAQAIFPPGVVNVISGGVECGERLTSHPDVAKISFTGSGATGKRIMAAAAPTLKKLTLELGGNDAAIILADADIALTAQALFWGKFHNSGQLCAAAKRIFVPDAIFDSFASAFVDVARTVKIGDGLDGGSALGPIQNKPQYDLITGMVTEASALGGRILFRGDAPHSGYFHPVIIFADVPDKARIVAEEAFGPVVALLRYTDIEDAVLRANTGSYGLGASVWSRDGDAAASIADRLEAGTSWVNQHPAINPMTPFGGIKQSGLGVEFGLMGMAEFTRMHIVHSMKMQ